jgi:hypothetical protein
MEVSKICSMATRNDPELKVSHYGPRKEAPKSELTASTSTPTRATAWPGLLPRVARRRTARASTCVNMEVSKICSMATRNDPELKVSHYGPRKEAPKSEVRLLVQLHGLDSYQGSPEGGPLVQAPASSSRRRVSTISLWACTGRLPSKPSQRERTTD